MFEGMSGGEVEIGYNSRGEDERRQEGAWELVFNKLKAKKLASWRAPFQLIRFPIGGAR